MSIKGLPDIINRLIIIQGMYYERRRRLYK
jgi:hypothetical protein